MKMKKNVIILVESISNFENLKSNGLIKKTDINEILSILKRI